MENVLTALVLGFLLIFGFLTLTEAMITTQDDLSTNLVALQDRLDDQHATQISPVDAHLATDKSVALLTFTNTGTTRLADFDQWDVIVEYYDDQDPAGYHINWLPYTDGIPVGQEWTVFTLYLDYAAEQDEVYEPNILNILNHPRCPVF